MATIGRHAAVAELGRMRLRGLVARTSWLFVHLLDLAGMRNRASVLLQWTLSYLTHDRRTRAVLGPSQIDQAHPFAPSSPRTASASTLHFIEQVGYAACAEA